MQTDYNTLYSIGELGLYFALILLTLVAAVYLGYLAALKRWQAQCQEQYNRLEWEQQRQQVVLLEDNGECVHHSTADFYKLDDGDDV